MHYATLITLILLTVLALSIRLLFTFSYITFIPWYMDFGVYLYFSCIFIVYFGRDYYFYRSVNLANKKNSHFHYVATPVLISIVIAFIILFNFKIPSNYNGIGEGGMAAAMTQLISYLILLACSMGVSALLFISANFKFNVASKNNNFSFPFNKFIQKTSFFYIPILIALICYTLFIAYSDYKTTGMKHGYSSKNNISAIYKKMVDKQDITYCDHLINTRDISYSIKRCYIRFFEKNEEIKQFKNQGKINQLNMIKNYFDLYSQIEKQQCQKTKKPSLCEELFYEETNYFVNHAINIATNNRIIFDGYRPKYYFLSVQYYSTYKETHNHLVNNLKPFMNNFIAYIKNSSGGRSFSYTNIYIHLGKLDKNDEKLTKIKDIIKVRKKQIATRYKKKKAIKAKKAAIEKRGKIQKFKVDMHKSLQLKPTDVVKSCLGKKHYTCYCAIPMCVKDEFVYNFPRVLKNNFILGSTYPDMGICYENFRQGKDPCNNIKKEDDPYFQNIIYQMNLRKRITPLEPYTRKPPPF